jgi:hypothetical protein
MVNDNLKWVPVRGYENEYLISNTGIVKSISKTHLRNGKKFPVNEVELTTRIDKMTGYWSVKLSKDGKCCTHHIHRLLAEAFIPQLAGKIIINHINGNKLDNRIENLEWCTYSENRIHAVKAGLCVTKPRPRRVVDTCTGNKYESIKAAACSVNIHYKKCQNMLYGKVKNTTCLKFAA